MAGDSKGRVKVNLLVLGGNGWVGGAIAAKALTRGANVTCLARGVSGEFPNGVEVIIGDRQNPESLHCFQERYYDAVVDISSNPSHVIAAAKFLEPRTGRYVYVSSVSVYRDASTMGTDESSERLSPLPPGSELSLVNYGEAKVSCEDAVLKVFGEERTFIIRPGVIGGVGDTTDRTGYWPLRFHRPSSPSELVLVPKSTIDFVQVIDIVDLANWIVLAIEREVVGIYNATHDPIDIGTYLRTVAEAVDFRGDFVGVSNGFLQERGVSPWSGPKSLPLWIGQKDSVGATTRSSEMAKKAGLTLRPISETAKDQLLWELSRDPSVPRRAGLSDVEELELINDYLNLALGGENEV